MQLHITDDLLVRSDGVCFTLIQTSVIQAPEEGSKGKAPKAENIGKTRERVLGHYGTLGQALSAVVHGRGLAGRDLDGVEELQSYLAVLLQAIEQIPQLLLQQIRQLEQQLKGAECASED